MVNLKALGERTLWLDCDVIDADGGTRTAAINGAFVALVDALHSTNFDAKSILKDSIAAISVGLLEGECRLDLEYTEDRDADVDANVVMTGRGEFVEVQASGEEATFRREQLDQLLALAAGGIQQVTAAQRAALGDRWPW